MLLDHDIAFYLIEDNDGIVIYRTYLAEMKTDVFENIAIDDRQLSCHILLRMIFIYIYSVPSFT